MAGDPLARIDALIVSVARIAAELGALRAELAAQAPVEPPPPPPPYPPPPPLVAAFRASATTGVAPLAIQLFDESEGEPDRFLWDFGRGATSTERNPTFPFQNPGFKHVRLTVWRGDDCASVYRENFIHLRPVATPAPSQGRSAIEIGRPGQPASLPVRWAHAPSAADVELHDRQPGEAARTGWLADYLRAQWSGQGSTSLFDDHQANTLAQTRLVLAPDGRPAYRFGRRRRKGLGDSDPINWRSSQIGAPWKGNGGSFEAATQFELWMPGAFVNYLDDPERNPRRLGAMFKLFWLFWGGPWNGRDLDDRCPASGGVPFDRQSDWSIRAQCNQLNGSKGREIGFKGYCYTLGREATGAPGNEAEQYGFGTPYSPAFRRDAWNEVRAYCRLNTVRDGVAQQDGILRLWLNGAMFVDLNDLNIVGTRPWKIQGCGPMLYNGGDNRNEAFLTQQDQSLLMTGFRMAG
ncbi:PKD domain-containing protein [Geminicoccus roseus]|uniref:PKD domain-containing protein n=1 Tax=Geminicoccus roseus TaxID=404900 RepID=UPI0003FAC99B|nr:PKD domain-containing protein [Geminicoccus roseus]